MTAKDKEPVKRVEKIIKEFDENLNVSLLKTSARTALEAATSLNCDVGAIVKSLLFKTDNNYALFLVAGDKNASLKKIKKNIKFSDVSISELKGGSIKIRSRFDKLLFFIQFNPSLNKTIDFSFKSNFLIAIFRV